MREVLTKPISFCLLRRMAAPKIKVCGLTREADIRAALALGVDYIGLNRYCGSPRKVPDAAMSGLLAAIPRGRRVYVDVSPDLDKLAEAQAAGFDVFQIHFDPSETSFVELAGWATTVGPENLWLAPRLKGGATFPERLLKYAAGWLVDGYSPGAFGGTGKTADWAGVAALKAAHPDRLWIVAGGLGPANVAEASEASRADVLDLNSGVEDAPGLKSEAKLRQALERLGRA